VNKKF